MGRKERNDMALIECRGLTKVFPGVRALAGVDLDIEKGQIVGLLGPNGSGKTTFIKLANGLLTPTEGTITIAGASPGKETKAKVAYLPDREYLPSYMKVKEVLNLYGDFYDDFNQEKARGMMTDLGIRPEQRIKSLSKGTREKVQLVLVMSREADVYLLDEPIGGVDPAARDFILKTIISNYREEAAVLISTHLIQDVESVLDDVIFIQNGGIVLHKPADDIRAERGKSIDETFREVFRC